MKSKDEISYRKKIVFLHSQMTGYLYGLIKYLSTDFSCEITVIHWDKKNINSSLYVPDNSCGVNYYPRSKFNQKKIVSFLSDFTPDIVVVAGWMDKGYLKALIEYRTKTGFNKVVAGIDDQWTGSVRQILGTYYFKLFYKKIFDFMWISGKPQYSYAQRFGFNSSCILYNLYSADTSVFNKQFPVNKRFLFVGRFDKIKKLDMLVRAYNRLSFDIQSDWPLVLIGTGEDSDLIREAAVNNSNITFKPFLQPQELYKEISKGGVGCLTSLKDQWGVVIHEFAISGYPILASTGCGAITEFLIPGFNGYLFKSNDEDSLYNALTKFSQLSNQELKEFSDLSHKLGQRINSRVAASSLMSVLYY
jgi:glycosyltransferase involved in cell wall biosynthesis